MKKCKNKLPGKAKAKLVYGNGGILNKLLPSPKEFASSFNNIDPKETIQSMLPLLSAIPGVNVAAGVAGAILPNIMGKGGPINPNIKTGRAIVNKYANGGSLSGPSDPTMTSTDIAENLSNPPSQNGVVINAEHKELIIDPKSNKVLMDLKNLPPHPEDPTKINPAGTLNLPDGFQGKMVIPKKGPDGRDSFLEAKAKNDKLALNRIKRNLVNKQEIMEANDAASNIEAYKEGGKIHIKPSHQGRFTAWAHKHGYTMSEAIAAGKNSSDPHVRKMATFAANARKWKHEDGGIIKRYDLHSIIDQKPGDYYDAYTDLMKKRSTVDNTTNYSRFFNLGSLYPDTHEVNSVARWRAAEDRFKGMRDPQTLPTRMAGQSNTRFGKFLDDGSLDSQQRFGVPLITETGKTSVRPLPPLQIQNFPTSSHYGLETDPMGRGINVKRVGGYKNDPNSSTDDPLQFDSKPRINFDSTKPTSNNRSNFLANNYGNLYQLSNALFNKETTSTVGNSYERQGLDQLKNRSFNIDPLLRSNERTYAGGRYALNQGGMNGNEYRANLNAQLRNKYVADSEAYATKNNVDNAYKGEYGNSLLSQGERNRAELVRANTANEQNSGQRQTAIASSLGSIGRNNQMANNDQIRLGLLPIMFPNLGKTPDEVMSNLRLKGISI